MTLTKDQIKEAALHLDPRDREALAEDLLLSVTAEDRESIDASWLQEVRRRDSSPMTVGINARTMESVLTLLEQRLGK
jgi:hypothetical protein